MNAWNNIDSDVDSTTLNRSHSNLSASDSRSQFAYQSHSNFSSLSSSPCMSPMTSFSRTSTPVSNRTSQSSTNYSPSNASHEWTPSDNSESWDYSQLLLRSFESPRAPPYFISRTPIRQSPNLQSPSVDSRYARSPSSDSFLKPYPPSKLENENVNLSQHYRNLSKVKRDLSEDINRCFLKNENAKSDRKANVDKVSIGVNTVPVNLNSRLETKAVGVDARTHRMPTSQFWPGLNDIVRPVDVNSSPSNPTSQFLPSLNYEYSLSPSATSVLSKSSLNDHRFSNHFHRQPHFENSFDLNKKRLFKSEDRVPPPYPFVTSQLNNYQVRKKHLLRTSAIFVVFDSTIYASKFLSPRFQIGMDAILRRRPSFLLPLFNRNLNLWVEWSM